jgi:hypothetical protein
MPSASELRATLEAARVAREQEVQLRVQRELEMARELEELEAQEERERLEEEQRREAEARLAEAQRLAEVDERRRREQTAHVAAIEERLARKRTQVEAGGSQDAEAEDNDEACWNCRSRNIDCVQSR